ncbi:MAG: acireductone synthase [Polyangiaceae bacterium]|nr:acireductone synthase [Polyangiaceae bacterium]
MIRAILTDIEGTTTRITLVRDVLFPHARQRLAGFVREHRGDPDVAAIVDDVRRAEGGASDEQVIACLLRWSDEDRKVTALKALQGLIWAEGYRSGALRGHVYDDALACLRAWRERGLRLYVYSSGSIAAQKLLFGHTEAGDLTGLFSGFFDTTTGGKLAPASYEAIARAVDLAPSDILFLSDHAGELDAARTAGLATTWIDRDGAPDAPRAAHPRATTFDEIRI